MGQPLIELDSVWKGFDGKQVLSGLDLQVYPGETLSILGGSGSGKSVTLKLMLGLLRPDRGHVRFRGRDVTDLAERSWREVRRHFGMVFQGAALFDSLSVFENVAYPIREHGSPEERELERSVSDKLALVGLEGIEALLPNELSGGMRKRVGVARAIALEPEVILYDEPTTGLDPANSRRIGELIRSLQRRLAVTSVVVTHDIPLCFGVSNRIGLLHEGRIVQLATPDELRETPGPEAREFLAGAVAAAPASG